MAAERERWILEKLRARLIHQAAIRRAGRPAPGGLRGRLRRGWRRRRFRAPGRHPRLGLGCSRNNRPRNSDSGKTANRSRRFLCQNLIEISTLFTREKSVRRTHTHSSTFVQMLKADIFLFVISVPGALCPSHLPTTLFPIKRPIS